MFTLTNADSALSNLICSQQTIRSSFIKPNIVLDNPEAKAAIEEVTNTSPEFLYGINLDSFSHSTQKIKWGQSFSDILSKNGVSNKDIYDASLLSRGVFNLKKIKKGNSYTLFFNNNSKKRHVASITEAGLGQLSRLRL